MSGKINPYKGLDEQIRWIKDDIKNTTRHMCKELSEQAQQDIETSARSILEQFYSEYDPKRYKRKDNLRKAIQTLVDDEVWQTGIRMNSSLMDDVYNIDPENVLDLMWMHGIRGLPRVGLEEKVNGETWVNPAWNQEIYKNIFHPRVSINGFTTRYGTPNQVMIEVVENWHKYRGVQMCNDFIKKYNTHIIKVNEMR